MPQLGNVLAHNHITDVLFFDLVDDWMSTRLARALNDRSISFETIIQSIAPPNFLTSAEDLSKFFGRPSVADTAKVNAFLHQSFYIQQHRRLNVLVSDDMTPKGGKWSFDTENRQTADPTAMKLLNHTEPCGSWIAYQRQPYRRRLIAEAVHYVEEHFPENYGSVCMFLNQSSQDTSSLFPYPVCHKQLLTLKRQVPPFWAA